MKRVLVTGAAGAIGGALARAIAATHPHAKIVSFDRERGDDPDVSYVQIDLREIDRLPALVEEHGPFDTLINCAGIMRVQSIATWDWQAAHDLMTIDLIAPLRLMDLAIKGGATTIVNVSSMAGKTPLKGCAYYGASKAGLAMASEIARAELAPRGIRVVTVYPGPVASALEAGARDDYGGAGWFGGVVPTGDPAELATRILDAIEHDRARVIYPRPYGFGWAAPNLASWFALAYGPDPAK